MRQSHVPAPAKTAHAGPWPPPPLYEPVRGPDAECPWCHMMVSSTDGKRNRHAHGSITLAPDGWCQGSLLPLHQRPRGTPP